MSALRTPPSCSQLRQNPLVATARRSLLDRFVYPAMMCMAASDALPLASLLLACIPSAEDAVTDRLPSARWLPLLLAVQMGDYVDIVANASVHKGMPHKYYHGRTGIVYNVAKRAVGVEVNKVVRNRVEKKRVNLRIEHIRQSKCRVDFLNRVKKNDSVKREAKKAGKRVPIEAIKRFPVAPKVGTLVTKGACLGSNRRSVRSLYPLACSPTSSSSFSFTIGSPLQAGFVVSSETAHGKPITLAPQPFDDML